MNFLADENLDAPIIERLRQDGHTVLSVAEMEAGIDDETVLELANQEMAVLLTSDKDFGELVFRLQRLTTGVILVRLAGVSLAEKAEIVSQVILQHAEELAGAFTVITSKRVRIRKLEI
ncbi:DUF5615 family PIN-like protein [Kovacikia minuta CCNUW1]|uniref:DUF5615 family PIN-like protein n=1 Tax=Kovacikia minuta TaxID=2931930 RepID=UPI001CCB51D9|nr:DUF5615 family PIN-like protein [Kovacikia minuta]UBF26673.1 DUF5615 family PIN-like protein [Kovacikia minuta CCNUW1]